MKTERLLLSLAAILLAGGCSRNISPSPEAPVARSGSAEIITSKPEVPEPNALPWTPPKNDLPADFVSAVTFLQAHGMADPRGGEFTQAFTTSLLAWDSVYSQPFMTAGWLAKQADGTVRFACEDGLAYGSTSGGRRANLENYVAIGPGERGSIVPDKALKTRQTVLLDNAKNDAVSVTNRGDGPVTMLPGWDLVAVKSGSKSKRTARPEMLAAMLLIDGRPDDAKKVLGGYDKRGEPILLTLSTDLLKSKWTRALATYAQGADRAALDLLLDAQALRAACESKIGRAANFEFMRQAPELIQDIQRRLKEPPRAASSSHGTIEEQIDALENYGLPLGPWSRSAAPDIERSSGLPGALFDEGDKAILPLIRAAGSDPRLTRQIISVNGAPIVASVREVALRVLNSLTGACFHPDRQGNLPTQTKLENWWSKNASLSVGEREFRLLADDSGDELQWAFAAKQISGFTGVETKASAVEQRWSQLRLTTHKNPSASELIVKRMNQILTGSSWPGAIAGAKVMELCLDRWDQPSAVAAARAFSDNLIRLEREKDAKHTLVRISTQGDPYGSADPDLLTLLEQRIASPARPSDESAVNEYVAVLSQVAVGPSPIRSDMFSFLYFHQNVPALSALVKKLCLDPVAAGTAKFNLRTQPLAYQVAACPMINLTPEQDAVVMLLQNKAIYGDVTRAQNGLVIVSGGDRVFDGGAIQRGEATLDAPSRWTVRVCDLVAQKVMSYGGNSFKTFWPTKQKDAIVNSLIQTLRMHPKRFWTQDTIWL